MFMFVIFGDDEGLIWFIELVGLMGVEVLCVGSFFDYLVYVWLYVLCGFFKFVDLMYFVSVVLLVLWLVWVLGGCIFVLMMMLCNL